MGRKGLFQPPDFTFTGWPGEGDTQVWYVNGLNKTGRGEASR